MTIDLDELLRTQFEDLVDESRGPLELLEQDVLRRVGRRRLRRRVGVGCGVLAAVALVAAAPTLLGDGSSPDVRTKRDGPTATTTTEPPSLSTTTTELPAPPVGIQVIEAYGGETGTGRIVVRFDGPVPTDAPRYVDDIQHPDAPGIAYTTQGSDGGIKVCHNTHSFPGELGTVDVLIPTSWLTPGIRGSDIPLERYDNPNKVPVCGGADDYWPLNGYIQIAVWGPASDDPDDVTATITPDGTALVVEIQP